MPDNLAALERIRDREEAASRGPWVHDPGYGYDSVTGRITLEAVTGPWTREDLEFIAHARTDVPRLLAAVDAVLKAADGWQRYAAEGDAQDECAREARKVILAALTGEGKADA